MLYDIPNINKKNMLGYTNIFIHNIIYMNINTCNTYIQCLCVYLYIHNKWVRLIAINRLTAQQNLERA